MQMLILNRTSLSIFSHKLHIDLQVMLHCSVAESSAETLNACGETVRPADLPARLDESGRIAPSSITSGSK